MLSFTSCACVENKAFGLQFPLCLTIATIQTILGMLLQIDCLH